MCFTRRGWVAEAAVVGGGIIEFKAEWAAVVRSAFRGQSHSSLNMTLAKNNATTVVHR